MSYNRLDDYRIILKFKFIIKMVFWATLRTFNNHHLHQTKWFIFKLSFRLDLYEFDRSINCKTLRTILVMNRIGQIAQQSTH